ncbi:MAG: hypothetical protein AAF561_02740 [Planctomycetota bacterium]
MAGTTDRNNQASRVVGHDNVVVQIHGDGNTVVAGVPSLHLTTYQSGRSTPPSTELQLLEAYRRTIDLVGRDTVMTELAGWLHDDRPIAIRTISGRAGSGKTRLALDLIASLPAGEEDDAWHAGFIKGREMQRLVDQQSLSTWGWQRPTLVVVDYAAAALDPLWTWITDLADHPRRDLPPLRLILIEREAETGGGWLQTLRSFSSSDTPAADLFRPLQPLQLERLEGPEAQRSILEQTATAAADLLRVTPPVLPPPDDATFTERLARPGWSEPLPLMMATLLATARQLPLLDTLAMSRPDLALELAERELARVARYADDGPFGSTASFLGHMAACSTLAGGLSRQEAVAVVERECDALRRTHPNGPAALADQAALALPRPDGGTAPVLPDLIGEALVLRVLSAKNAEADGSATCLRLLEGHE